MSRATSGLNRSVERSSEAPAEWDEAAARSAGGHVLQSSVWARIRAGQGWEPEFVRIGRPFPLALVLWRRLPVFGPIGYVPRGPILGTSADIAPALAALAEIARQRRAVFLKVDPELTAEDAGQTLGALGYRRGPDVQALLATLQIDLSQDLDAVLGGLDKDTRWSVRQGAKRGVTVRESRDENDLRAFYDLYAATGTRARFITRTWEYYALVWRQLIEAQLATLRLAYYEGRPVAGAMTWQCGERDLYMYGASNEAARKTFASYTLQWECIAGAKARGALTYDLGGIPPDPSRKDDPMYGPYLFKKGFGGAVRRWVGAHDLVPRPFAYRAYLLAEPAYTLALRVAGGREVR